MSDMLLLVVGTIIFFGVHLLPTQVQLRASLRERFGAKPYELGFIVLSLLGVALMVYGYGKIQGMPGKNPILWVAPNWMRHLLWVLMLPTLILLVAANVPSRIRDRVGHPMLLSTKIWAAGHLLVNGTLAGVILFGSFLAWAVVDLMSVKRRGARGPLGARAGTLTGDAVAVAGGTLLWIFMLVWGHSWLIGVALLPPFAFAP
jgi:uncharacterized membrane protein